MFPGSTLSDHCIRYQHIPAIKLIVVLGELGGQDEYSLVSALILKLDQEEVVVWCWAQAGDLQKQVVGMPTYAEYGRKQVPGQPIAGAQDAKRGARHAWSLWLTLTL